MSPGLIEVVDGDERVTEIHITEIKAKKRSALSAHRPTKTDKKSHTR
jgi:hypothetical protein